MASLSAPAVPPSSVVGGKASQPRAAAPEGPVEPPPAPQQPAPEATAPPPPEPKTASLAVPPVVRPSPPFNPESAETLKAAQEELRRLGCYGGGIDGMTGPQTRGALAAAAAKLGSNSGVQPLTEQGLQALRDHKGVLCPPTLATKAAPVQPTAPAVPSYVPPPVAVPAPASPPPPAVVSNPPPAAAPAPAQTPAPAPASQERRKIHISM